MELFRKKEKCCGCGACIEICPEGAVTMEQDWEGFFYPKINKDICTGCGKCRKVCPLKEIGIAKDKNLYFGARTKDESIRYSSSSGGIFSVLANFVISRQGIVYGAGYDENMNVVHQSAKDDRQLGRIQKSKYVQSDMRGIYSSVQENLEESRWVLFCGTPCQVQALKMFIGKEYERLILVDLVCYGVPSPGVWKAYVKYLEQKHRGRLTDFVFRDKRNADNGHMRSYKIDGVEYIDYLHEDLYCKTYFMNLALRKSCHNCKFCSVDRNSDFTIGDFWGIEQVKAEFNDGMGISLVIVHSDRAKKIWDQISSRLIWFQCKKEELLQPRLLYPTSSAKRIQRAFFMFFYKILPFSKAVKLMKI